MKEKNKINTISNLKMNLRVSENLLAASKAEEDHVKSITHLNQCIKNIMEMKGEINVLQNLSEERLRDYAMRSVKDWRFTIMLKLHGY